MRRLFISTSPSLIITNVIFMIIMIIVIVKATHGRGVPHEASEARPSVSERRALAPTSCWRALVKRDTSGSSRCNR